MPCDLTVQELKAWMDEGKAFRLIDVREREEWEQRRLPGAELHPFSGLPGRLLESLRPGECVVVYCHHGHRSERAACFLALHGIHPVFNLGGGIDAWAKWIDPAVPAH